VAVVVVGQWAGDQRAGGWHFDAAESAEVDGRVDQRELVLTSPLVAV
jgi:hypothetical protein